MEKTTYFPIYVNMNKREILVFGGGKIGTRRIKVLLDFGAKVTAVAPYFSDELKDLAREQNNNSNNLVLKIMDFEHWLKNEGFSDFLPFFVLGATDNKDVNQQIFELCKKHNIPVNICDNNEKCDFYFPAIIRKDDVVIGVSSDGKNHKKVKDTAAKLRVLDI